MAKARLTPDTWEPWEPWELQVLRDNPTAHDKDIAAALPRRTEDAVKQKRYTTGTTRSFNGEPLQRGEIVVSVYDKQLGQTVVEAATLRQCVTILGIPLQTLRYLRKRHADGFGTRRWLVEEVCPAVIVRKEATA